MSENLPAPENLLDAERIQMIKNFRNELTGFMLNYQFGIDEILTKINILKTEFSQLHEYAPIEHVSSRLKTPESIVKRSSEKETSSPSQLSKTQCLISQAFESCAVSSKMPTQSPIC